MFVHYFSFYYEWPPSITYIFIYSSLIAFLSPSDEDPSFVYFATFI